MDGKWFLLVIISLIYTWTLIKIRFWNRIQTKVSVQICLVQFYSDSKSDNQFGFEPNLDDFIEIQIWIQI